MTAELLCPLICLPRRRDAKEGERPPRSILLTINRNQCRLPRTCKVVLSGRQTVSSDKRRDRRRDRRRTLASETINFGLAGDRRGFQNPTGCKSNQAGRRWRCFNCQMEGGPGPAWDHRDVQSRQSRRAVADPNITWPSLYPGSMFPNAITKTCLPSRHTAHGKFNHPLLNCDRSPPGLLEGVCPRNTISGIRVDMLN